MSDSLFSLCASPQDLDVQVRNRIQNWKQNCRFGAAARVCIGPKYASYCTDKERQNNIVLSSPEKED